jgi:multisubunit Na+/H+ antiporter MnhF subunit
MSGNEIALTMIIVIALIAVIFTLALNRWVKVPRDKP